jgi:DNA-binding CsgD family transcriptional regulator
MMSAGYADVESLSPREREVLELVLKGLSAKEIAAKLGITLETVNGYIKSLHTRLGVHTRGELHALFSKRPRRQRPAVEPPAP